MHLLRSGLGQQILDITGADAAAGENGDTIAVGGNEVGQFFCLSWCGSTSGAGEHPVHAKFDQLLQPLILIGDALADFSTLVAEKLDVVVSNPPYIPQSDEPTMRRNVTDYEPATALFVEDSDPLIFYRSIARSARKMLKPGGKLFYEIYELYADDMVAMLSAEGYVDIVVREDFRVKPRMICATMSL